MFLSEWREFPSAPCIAGGKKNLTARVPDILPSLFPFLVGLRTYQHPGTFSHHLTFRLLNTCTRKASSTILTLHVRENELLFVFWYEKYVLLSIIQSITEYFCMNVDTIIIRRNSHFFFVNFTPFCFVLLKLDRGPNGNGRRTEYGPRGAFCLSKFGYISH